MSRLVAARDAEEGLEASFRARKKLVDGFPGFQRLQLVKGRGTGEYLLFLEWDTMEAFRAYAQSPAFAHAHPPDGPDVEPGGLRIYDVVLDSARGE